MPGEAGLIGGTVEVEMDVHNVVFYSWSVSKDKKYLRRNQALFKSLIISLGRKKTS